MLVAGSYDNGSSGITGAASLLERPAVPSAFLLDGHRRELEASAIDPAVVAERRYESVGRPSRADNGPRERLKRAGIPTWATAENYYFPGLLIPMYGPTGTLVSCQWKPRNAVPDRNGKPQRYASPRGQKNRLDVHPRNRSTIADPTVPLWITEGVKKADALTSRGVCIVALTGVFTWRSQLGTLGDWEDVPLKGREVTVCFDADAAANPRIARAMTRVGRWLQHAKRVKRVHYLVVPPKVNGVAVKGVDDFLAAGGTLAELEAARTASAPKLNLQDDTFSDARLAETVADEVFDDRFCWCVGLGWLGWNGMRWAEASEFTVSEAVRVYAIDRFMAALEEAKSGGDMEELQRAVTGWRAMLTVGRRSSVIRDAKGIVEHRADEFDADRDILNTPAGVLDFLTRQVLPHSPDLLMTKISSGSYLPGYVHEDWEQALTALPPEERRWLQARYGQAITGHPVPDDVLVVEQGGGENGKGVLGTDGVVPALGDYASVASAKLLVSYSSKHTEHSTEVADLRGQRLMIAEEMTESHALNVQMLKQVMGVGRIKARLVHRDNVQFDPSHSLFATTNYVPVVNETDHGTWRRLKLLAFPYRFRKAYESMEGPNDRPGDIGLKPRIRAGATGQHDAIVTWAVEGAFRVYENAEEALAPTARVEADTAAWRRTADRILGFWDDRLVVDKEKCILTTEALDEFNEWLDGNGHYKWSKEQFASRFKAHGETVANGVEEQRPRVPKGLVRRSRRFYITAGPQPLPKRATVYQGVRYRTAEDDAERCPICRVVADEPTEGVVPHACRLPTDEPVFGGAVGE